MQTQFLYLNVFKKLAHFDFKMDHHFPLSGITAILGVSGAGKSTFLNLINGMALPDQGFIQLHDRVLIDREKKIQTPIHQRQIATVFQDPLLFPHLSIKKNLLYGASKKSVFNHNKESSKFFNQLIQVLNLSETLDRYPATLSGGEKQRVAIGRALLSQPQLLLMDEPLSSLDFARKKELIHYIRSLQTHFKIPIFLVSHNLNEVRLLADRIAIIEQGKITHFGEADTILNLSFLQDWI